MPVSVIYNYFAQGSNDPLGFKQSQRDISTRIFIIINIAIFIYCPAYTVAVSWGLQWLKPSLMHI